MYDFLFQSDPEPVNFKHLLSMGYQRDWLNEQDQKSKEKRAERKVWSICGLEIVHIYKIEYYHNILSLHCMPIM